MAINSEKWKFLKSRVSKKNEENLENVNFNKAQRVVNTITFEQMRIPGLSQLRKALLISVQIEVIFE